MTPRIATAVALIGAVVGGLVSLTPNAMVVVLAAAAIVSLPHGALDVAVGPVAVGARWPLLYVSLATTTLVAWATVPEVALGAFVLIAWWHFGSGDVAAMSAPVWVRSAHGVGSGGVVLGAAFTLHAERIAAVVDHLPGAAAPVVATLGSVVFWCALAAGSVAVVGHLTDCRTWHAAELVALVVMAVIADPLISFSVYFVGVHAMRHVEEVRAARVDIDARHVAVASAVPLLGGVVVWSIGLSTLAVAVPVVIVGLATLTTPHLMTTEWARHRRSSSPLTAPTSVRSLPERIPS